MNWTPAKVSEYPSQAAEHIQNLEAQRDELVAALSAVIDTTVGIGLNGYADGPCLPYQQRNEVIALLARLDGK